MDKKPRKPFNPPLDSVWAKAARELSENPDSPQSLRIMSGINAALRPRIDAVQQVVEALANQMEEPGERADAAVAAAIAHWKAATDAVDEDHLLEGMRKDAAELLESRRSQPPVLESIVHGIEQTDVGYDLGVHLHGLKGTWHRLWGAIVMSQVFRSPESVETVAVVRDQFEGLLGRHLSEDEWGALERHAMARAATMPRPRT